MVGTLRMPKAIPSVLKTRWLILKSLYAMPERVAKAAMDVPDE